MNVKDLIEKLSQYNPETLVVVSGYEGGVTETFVVSENEVSLNVYDESESWCGEHEIATFSNYIEEKDGKVFDKTNAVLILR